MKKFVLIMAAALVSVGAMAQQKTVKMKDLAKSDRQFTAPVQMVTPNAYSKVLSERVAVNPKAKVQIKKIEEEALVPAYYDAAVFVSLGGTLDTSMNEGAFAADETDVLVAFDPNWAPIKGKINKEAENPLAAYGAVVVEFAPGQEVGQASDGTKYVMYAAKYNSETGAADADVTSTIVGYYIPGEVADDAELYIPATLTVTKEDGTGAIFSLAKPDFSPAAAFDMSEGEVAGTAVIPEKDYNFGDYKRKVNVARMGGYIYVQNLDPDTEDAWTAMRLGYDSEEAMMNGEVSGMLIAPYQLVDEWDSTDGISFVEYNIGLYSDGDNSNGITNDGDETYEGYVQLIYDDENNLFVADDFGGDYYDVVASSDPEYNGWYNRITNMYLSLDGPTAIKGVNANVAKVADGSIYNLAGQKVGKNYKGVVVKDGKKFLQK